MILPLLLASSCLAAGHQAQLEYLRGQLLERQGAYPEALAAYEVALSSDPDSAYLNREAAGLALETGQTEKALGWAQRAAKLEPKSAQNLALLGKVQWAAGKPEEAEASFRTALKLDPKSAESIFSLGGLLASKSPEKAKELLTRFLEQNPAEASEAHFQLAKIEQQLGRAKAAQRHYREAIALDPDSESLQARYALAESYELERSTDAALAEYLRILRLEPTNVALLDHIAQLYVAKGDWDAMREKLQEAKARQDDDPAANHWLALDAERAGELSKAADFLKASAALKDEPTLNLRLSYYLSQSGRLKEAVAVLEDARKRWPQNDQIAYFLALGYDDLKRPDDAIKTLRQVLALKPDMRDAHYQLGVLLERKGKMEEAEAEFRRLLADKPDDASILNYLGYSLAERGMKLDEAKALIDRAVKLDPKSAAYRDSLGWVDFKLGKTTEAVANLQLAADALPDDQTVWDHFGDALHAAGQEDKAWKAWKRSESLAPSGEKLAGKAAKIENEFEKADLGKLYMLHLRKLQGGMQKITGLCELRGKILGREFTYPCMVTFQAPDRLDVDLLGPLFTPVFRIRMTESDFMMDPLKLEGLDPERVAESAQLAVMMLRDYVSSRYFGLAPAEYKKSWWRGRRWLEVTGWRLYLDKASVRAEAIQSLESGMKLTLKNFGRTEGREVAREMTVTGQGFTLTLEFENVKITFK